MKRFPTEKRWRWKRLAAERFKRRLRSKLVRDARRGKLPRRSNKETRAHAIRLAAPEIFALEGEQYRAPILSFLSKLRELYVRRRSRVLIDFTHTKRMLPSGTLLFVAELDRLNRLEPTRRGLRGNYPRDRVVEQVLQQVGVFDILGVKGRLSETGFADNVKHWRYATGLLVEGSKFERVAESIEGRMAEPLTRGFFAGVTEAMTNAVHHAYAAPRGDDVPPTPELRRWWMFSQVKDGDISVAFCDTGIGIPRSLRRSDHWSKDLIGAVLTNLGFDGTRDSDHIQVAMQLRRSSTGEAHRGRGLGEILDVVRNANAGAIRIYSNKGFYYYNGKTGTPRVNDFRQSIMGTVIHWALPLNAEPAAPH